MGMEKSHRKPRSKFTVALVPGGGYAVLDPKGERVAMRPRRDNAEMACAAHQQIADREAKRMQRPCLCCGAGFLSAGVHNRLCGSCRGRSAGEAEQRPYILAGRR